MTEQIKETILAKISEMENVIENYHDKTVEILTTDIDETLEQIAAERGELLKELDVLFRELDEVTASCTPEEKNVVDSAIKSGHAPLSLSPELKEIRKAIINMRSVYIKAAEKDTQAAARVDARVKELRSELEELSGSRKTLDYFSRNKLDSPKGGSFDSSL